jgi:predicted HicB family RNase H-like nuclease
MAALVIRDVSEELRDRLAAMARERGQSLEEYLHAVIVEAVNNPIRPVFAHWHGDQSR